ncbi:hypothetical protein LTR36_004842 [Oleoguttula mirabilis]|uniref:RING-type domain-containing protein n=1 Tax=Oleoguttula mirabilis TaxID=1507867 RepID=A0AAV9JEY1_9PEZI|nr:hypothetical protein LTR36_004842 [Oleoguttula mirabilis]
MYLPDDIVYRLSHGCERAEEFYFGSCFLWHQVVNDRCCICVEDLTPPAIPNTGLTLVKNGACDHVFHLACIIKTIKRKASDRSVCPLCRAKWFDSDKLQELVAEVTHVLLRLRDGELDQLDVTKMNVLQLADDMTRCVQTAAYASVRFGNPFAVTEDACAIIGGMLTVVNEIDKQSRCLEVVREQLHVRSAHKMRQSGDGRTYTEEMSSFAFDVAIDAVAIYDD